MLTYPEINPVAIQLGPLAIHWYGLMYLVGFVGAWLLLTWRVRHSARGFNSQQISDILFYGAFGMIIGGRVGYVLFYNWPEFISYPLMLFQIWKGGMSFHGGLIGVILALWIYANRHDKSLVDVTDLVAPVVPIGLGAGRIGNFINSELWGRVTDMPWGMVFPNGGPQPRHPSQLYEFFLEGVLMFSILWIFSKKRQPRGATSGLFLICYGVFRVVVEFFREPDQQIGYIAFGWLTKGQLLSVPMIILGVGMMSWAYWRKSRCNNI